MESPETGQEQRRRHTDITHTFESSDGRKAYVVKILNRWVVQDSEIQELGMELSQYSKQYPRHEICIDLSGVDFLSAGSCGKFITLHQKIRANVEQPLYLVGLHPEIYEVLEITKLSKVFEVRRTVEEYRIERGFIPLGKQEDLSPEKVTES